jgi:MoaA/NifB/PqqE/SkfB family radical SAM enzyme
MPFPENVVLERDSSKQTLGAGLCLTVLTTVNALNLHELPSLLKVLRIAGVNHWQIQPIFRLGRAHRTAELELTQ